MGLFSYQFIVVFDIFFQPQYFIVLIQDLVDFVEDLIDFVQDLIDFVHHINLVRHIDLVQDLTQNIEYFYLIDLDVNVY